MLDIQHEDFYTSKNLAIYLTDDELITMARVLKEGYASDKASRGEWEDNLEGYIKLANQVMESKTYPWNDASNVKYPLLTTASLQYNARAYPALVPAKNVVKGKTIGFDKQGLKSKAAIRVGKFMTYQVLHDMAGWEEDMDKLCMVLPLIGTSFKKTYYNTVTKNNVSELVLPQDLVVNYYAKSLEDATCKTHIMNMYPNEITAFMAEGIYREIELHTSGLNEKEGDVTEVTGVAAPVTDKSRPFDVLEMHCEYDLDGDGYNEPYIVTMLQERNEILRIVPRFKRNDVSYLNNSSKVLRIAPIEYFTCYQFIPNPQSGIYGVGFGKLLGPLNESINTILNILLDSGHLATIQGGFIAKGTRIKGGDTQFRPGEWKMAQTTGESLKNNIVPLPVKEPSSVLFSLLGMLVQSAEKLSSTTDVMTGDLPGQNTKATVMMKAIENGSKVFTSIHKRMYRSLASEFKKLFLLNNEFLPYKTYFTALDTDVSYEVFRQDFDITSIDVLPAADPNIATEEQRLGRVNALFEVLQMIPNKQEAIRRYLEATDQPNIDVLMQPPPAQPSLEEQQLQFEKERFQQEHQLAAYEAETERMRVETQAVRDDSATVLNVAKAEEIAQKPALEMMKEATKRSKVNQDNAIKVADQLMKDKELQEKEVGSKETTI